MIHNQTKKSVLEIIEKLELPEINRLNYLENKEPTIYLCGKSSTGKTTFLNALFEMEKDELFTSTDISTRTEFRFQYGEVETIEKSDGTIINMPSNRDERKILFNSINEEANSCHINLKRQALKNRVIVDIPGVLDFNRNNMFSDKMLDEADIVCFFTRHDVKISDSEYKLLNNITSAGISIIVLFTMGDITDVDEGITRKTIPKLVRNRLSTCFNGIKVEHYQIISSNDFYKNKNTNGIDLLMKHIEDNDQKYKVKSEKNRIERTVQHYISMLEDKLELLNSDNEHYKNSVIKEIDIKFKMKKKELEDKHKKTLRSFNSEINRIKNNCKDQILEFTFPDQRLEQKTTSSKREEKFKMYWDEDWSELINEFDFIQIQKPKLPPFPNNLFEDISINNEKLKEIFNDFKKNSKNKNDDNQENKEDYNLDTYHTGKSRSSEGFKDDGKNTEKKSTDKIINILESLQNMNETGINLANLKILYNKIKYFKKIDKIIETHYSEQKKLIENHFQSEFSKLEQSKQSNLDDKLSKNPTTTQINKYNKSINQLKTL